LRRSATPEHDPVRRTFIEIDQENEDVEQHQDHRTRTDTRGWRNIEVGAVRGP